MKHWLYCVCAVTMAAAPVSPAHGQYFERKIEPRSDRFLSAGFLVWRFEPRFTNTQADSLRISYRRTMPTIGFRQGLVDVAFGYMRYTLHGQGRSAMFLGLSIARELPMMHAGMSAFMLRVLVSSDYTRAESNGRDTEHFVVGSAGLGAGLTFRLRQSTWEFSLGASEAVHASFESFSTGIGFSAATIGEAVVLLHQLVVLDGIAIGYRFRYQTWNMNNAKLDYRSLSHGAFLGGMF